MPAAPRKRYTTALVSWSDPSNAYADAMEPVFEQALVARYGFNQLEMTAIGCTGSQKQTERALGYSHQQQGSRCFV
jgi:predicted phage tail protein